MFPRVQGGVSPDWGRCVVSLNTKTHTHTYAHTYTNSNCVEKRSGDSTLFFYLLYPLTTSYRTCWKASQFVSGFGVMLFYKDTRSHQILFWGVVCSTVYKSWQARNFCLNKAWRFEFSCFLWLKWRALGSYAEWSVFKIKVSFLLRWRKWR